MTYVPTEDLIEKIGSVYKLVILASRRVAELNGGSPKLIDANPGKTGTIALEEIREDKVSLKHKEKK